MLTLREIASTLGGEVAGREVVAPGPNHSPKDRSLGIVLSDRNPDGFVCRSYAGDDWRACRDYVAGRLGLPLWEPTARTIQDDPLARMQARARAMTAEKEAEAARENRKAYAIKVWFEAQPFAGSLADTYMSETRGLPAPTRPAVTDVLRFHPAGPWGKGGRAPMMVAPITNMVSGEMTGLHRTALTPDAQKVDRKMIGVAGGGAVMLVPATRKLIVGEGIESALSAYALGFADGAGLWAVGSAGTLGSVPVLDSVDHLVLLEERDKASANAVSDTGHRWSRAGKRVSVILPTIGNDLNDSLRGIA